jgi:D-hexose-6-phosphate mutarotase
MRIPGAQSLEDLQRYEIPGPLRFVPGEGGLPKALFSTPWSEGELFLQGAQVTRFQKRGDAPLLFLSQASRFARNTVIRGGIPICFPWFGPRPGAPSHGYARLSSWDFRKAEVADDGQVTLRLVLPQRDDRQALSAQLTVMAGPTLNMELVVTNLSPEEEVSFEDCLHTYFAVGDITQIRIEGLESDPYLDHLQNNRLCPPLRAPLTIFQQTDRTFPNQSAPIQIHDPVLRQVILLKKEGSASTVVWNPWSTQPLTDLAAGEYQRFVCVESGNIGGDRITLRPGASAVLRLELDSHPMVN